VPTIERLDLLDPILAAGGVRSRIQAWTEWGWMKPPPEDASLAVNLRREVLDPLVREAAASTSGVDLHLGHAAHELVRDGEAFSGVVTRDRDGRETTFRAKLVIGADGRVDKFETDPEIEDRDYLEKFSEIVMKTRFRPARTRSGVPVAVVFPMDFILATGS
jgi:hypothetical protein